MRRDNFHGVIPTPLPGGWRVGFRLREGVLEAVEFLDAQAPLIEPGGTEAQWIAGLLAGYFRDPLAPLGEIPLSAAPTPFQDRVRNLMSAIPVGETRAYRSLAQQLATAPRAVAGACRANPVPLVVPCHRVVSVSGLGGFMGALGGPPLELKTWLLRHESV